MFPDKKEHYFIPHDQRIDLTFFQQTNLGKTFNFDNGQNKQFLLIPFGQIATTEGGAFLKQPRPDYVYRETSLFGTPAIDFNINKFLLRNVYLNRQKTKGIFNQHHHLQIALRKGTNTSILEPQTYNIKAASYLFSDIASYMAIDIKFGEKITLHSLFKKFSFYNLHKKICTALKIGEEKDMVTIFKKMLRGLTVGDFLKEGGSWYHSQQKLVSHNTKHNLNIGAKLDAFNQSLNSEKTMAGIHQKLDTLYYKSDQKAPKEITEKCFVKVDFITLGFDAKNIAISN